MEGKMRSIYNALGRMVLIALFAVVLTLIPANKAYASVTVTIGDYTYYLNDSTFKATVEGYVGAGGDISIPSTVEYDSKTYSVTGIQDSAFQGCTSLTSVSIPDSVTSIGIGAFYGCSGLTSIDIPDGVTIIQDETFYGCSGLISIDIPDGVTYIGEGAFYGCTGLTSIDIPDSVTTLMMNTFEGCSGLTSITIPGSLNRANSIGTGTFKDCTGLTSVTIKDGVVQIGAYMFEGCTGLTSIVIPDGVSVIGQSAFSGCSGLTSIVIPDSVTSINNNAFTGCSNLTEFYYPYSLYFSNIGLDSTVTSIIGCKTNTDDTITLFVENIADAATALALPSTYCDKTVSAIEILDGVRKLQLTSVKPLSIMNVDCSKVKIGDLPLVTNWVWQDADKNTALTVGTPVTATATYNALDKAIYSNTEVEITVTTTHTGSTTIKNAKATSCKETGYTGDTYCVTCDKKISDGSTIPKSNDHTYDEGVPTTKATFTDTGVMTYTCTVCTTQTRTEDIPALTAPSATITTTCSNDTVSDITLPANWQWKNSDADKVLTLDSPVSAVAVYEGADKANYSTTELTITITTSHTGETTLKNVKEASCKEAGYTGDTYCVNCDTKISDGNVVAKTNTHSYNNGVITKQATTTAKGIKTYTCTVCKATKTEDIAQLPATSEDLPKEETPKTEVKPEVKPEVQPEETPETDEESSVPVEPDEEKETSEDDVTEDTSNDEEETTAPVVQPDSTDKELSKDKNMKFFLRYHPSCGEDEYFDYIEKTNFLGVEARGESVSEMCKKSDFSLVGSGTSMVFDLIYLDQPFFEYREDWDGKEYQKRNNYFNDFQNLKLGLERGLECDGSIFKYYCTTREVYDTYNTHFQKAITNI